VGFLLVVKILGHNRKLGFGNEEEARDIRWFFRIGHNPVGVDGFFGAVAPGWASLRCATCPPVAFLTAIASAKEVAKEEPRAEIRIPFGDVDDTAAARIKLQSLYPSIEV
jgi:hypothetical protein